MTYARLVSIGKHLSSRDRARRLREQLVSEVGNKPIRITVDLEGVQSLSESFADEFFAILVRDHGEEWFRERIHVVNASELVRSAIVRAVRTRLEPTSQSKGTAPVLCPPPAVLEKAS